MKKLIFLSLMLLNLSIFCTIEQTAPQSETFSNRQRRLNRAIKKRNLASIVEIMKNIKIENGSMDFFNNKKLLKKAKKKFKNQKALFNDSNTIDEILYTLIPISFLAPYGLFYYFYRNHSVNILNYATRENLEATTSMSIALTAIATLVCIVRYVFKSTAHKESKLIYKILKEYSSKDQSGETNV